MGDTAQRMMRALFAAVLAAVCGGATDAAAQTVGGKYDAKGTNLDGSPYHGSAVITRTSNSTCRIHWNTGTTADGICMLVNRSFAAAYAMGRAYGLIVYELRDDGSLDGVWTIADQPGAGTETLTPIR